MKQSHRDKLFGEGYTSDCRPAKVKNSYGANMSVEFINLLYYWRLFEGYAVSLKENMMMI